MRRCYKVAGFAVMLVCAPASHAALVSVDWKTAGDGLATLDTVTGLEWLDLTVTDGFSLNKALSQMGVGGQLAGWRFPTHKEVVDMLARQLPTQNYRENETIASRIEYGAEDAEATAYRALFGTTYSTEWVDGGWAGGTHGIYMNDNQDAANLPSIVSANVHRSDTTQTQFTLYSINSGNTYSMSYSHANMGVFMVSDGGVTRSSLLNPALNINNPNAPVNQATTVPVKTAGFFVFGAGFCLRAARSRQKEKRANT